MQALGHVNTLKLSDILTLEAVEKTFILIIHS